MLYKSQSKEREEKFWKSPFNKVTSIYNPGSVLYIGIKRVVFIIKVYKNSDFKYYFIADATDHVF